MTISNGYATLAEAKTRLGISDTVDDAVLEAVVEAVSRWIDNYTNRRFYRNSADETRYYTAKYTDLLELNDDLGTITTLKTDDDGDRTYDETWATTDYDLLPFNASLDSKPYTVIQTTPDGDYSFPANQPKGVEIVGKFGYAATAPDAINEACLLQVSRIFRRKDAPFGIAGAPEFGQTAVIPRLDPDVRMLLQPFVKIPVGAF